MNTKVSAVTLGFAFIVTSLPVSAHHSFSAEYDANRPVTLKGKIVKIEWINPHSWFTVDVTDAKGKPVRWRVEAGTPNTLLRRGLTRDSVPIGTEVAISGFQAKDGSLKANGRDLLYADGRKMFMASSGTGAPGEKR